VLVVEQRLQQRRLGGAEIAMGERLQGQLSDLGVAVFESKAVTIPWRTWALFSTG